MLAASAGRLQFSQHRVHPLPEADARSCAQACEDAADCGGMTVGPAGPVASGQTECRLATPKAARNAALLPDAGWTSSTKAERPDRLGPSREKFEFATASMQGYDVPQGAKTTDELLADCTAACEKVQGCRAVSVRNPDSGTARCDLWDAVALSSLKRTPDPDGKHAGAVLPVLPVLPAAAERYTFGAGVKPMRVRATPAAQSAADVLSDCVEECEETEFCRAATAYATGKGKGKCSLWNAAALATLKREADSSGRYGGAVLPEKATVSSSGPGFEPLREIALPQGTVGGMLAACRKECLASKKACGVISLDGNGTCYLGAPQALKPQTGSDPRWTREVVVNAEDPAAPPPQVPVTESFTSDRLAAPAAPAAAAEPTVSVGWFSGTGVFEAPAGTSKTFAPYTGSVDSSSLPRIGTSAYDIAPADLVQPQYAVVRKNTLTTAQSMLLTAAVLLAGLLFMWMFVFFLQGTGVTVERLTGMYRGIRDVVKSPEARKGLSHAVRDVRAAAGV